MERLLNKVFYCRKATSRYICPCCNGQFRKLLPFGRIRRENAKCPKCGSLERHRLEWLYLKEQTKFFCDKLMVLHFAPEQVFQKSFKLLSNLCYISADLNSPHAMLKMDITDIYFRDNVFDVILCNHVLEHVPDDKRAMRELYRVLKPGGWAILQVPIGVEKTIEYPSVVSAEERERLFGQADHVRRYGLDYKDRLEEAGFKVRVDDYAKRLGGELCQKYALELIDIYYCIKE